MRLAHYWRPEDIHAADFAVLGVAQEDLLDSLPGGPASALDQWAITSPRATCLVTEGHTWSYAQVALSKNQLAADFSRLGIKPVQRVVLCLENGLPLVIALLALNQIGAIAVILSPRLTDFEQQKIIDHALPIGVIKAATELPATTTEQVAGSAEAGLSIHGLKWAPREVPPEIQLVNSGSPIAAMIYTTGTTGAPKGVMLTNQNLMFTGFVSGKLRGMTPEDRVLTALPLSHAFGLSAVLCSVLVQGASLYLEATFSAKRVIKTFYEQGITGFLGVPAMYSQILDSHQGEMKTFPALRFIFSGGAPLDLKLKSAVEQFFGLPLHNGYGMTESGPTIAQTRLYAPLSDTSVGFVIPGVSYRIEPLSKAVSGVGELQVSGPNIMAGYFRAQTLTESVIKEGWLSTGDLAKVSEIGTLEIVGRIKELIIRNGFNVYPPEVEAALMSLPEVKQAAVVGDRQAGNESILAFVEIWSDHRFDDEEARKALKQKLAGYKLPDRIQVVDALPAAPSGKILKHRLTINGLDRGVD